MGTTTTPDGLYKATPGEKGWGGRTNENWDVVQSVLSDLRASAAAETAHETDTGHLHIRVSEPPPELRVSPTGDDSFDGRFDRPMLTPSAAVAALGARGGRVLVAPGAYSDPGVWDVHGKTSVSIQGAGGLAPGAATAATSITSTYAGAAPGIINAQSSKGLRVSDLALIAPSGYTGALIDLTHDATLLTDSAYWAVERCTLTVPAGIGVNVLKAIDGVISQSHFAGYLYGIKGCVTSGDYADAITIEKRCVFRDGTAGGYAIYSDGGIAVGWAIRDPVFEIGATPAVWLLRMMGLDFAGWWAGDASADDLTFVTLGGWGVREGGGFASGGNRPGTALSFVRVDGLSRGGSKFQNIENGVVIDADCTSWDSGARDSYENVDNPFTAPAPSVAAGAGAGTSPPAPVLGAGATDNFGTLTSGTGTAPAAGTQVVLTFAKPRTGVNLRCRVGAKNTTTASVRPFANVNSTTLTISLGAAPAGSLANTALSYEYEVYEN